MTYVRPNFPTKKALREAIADGRSRVEVFEPGLGTVPFDGVVFLEGPWAPKAHSWYAQGRVVRGRLVSVK